MDRSIVTLYHGSRNGLRGAIRPASDGACDFGSGFYLGTEKTQPQTLICGAESPVFYTLSLDLSGLRVYRFEPDERWALFVAYNRGRLESYRSRRFYRELAAIRREHDVLVGRIANDRMFLTMNEFFGGSIGLTALRESLLALNLGDQYCLRTKAACAQLEIKSEKRYSPTELKCLRERRERQRRRGVELADAIRLRRRREGIFFDELLRSLK